MLMSFLGTVLGVVSLLAIWKWRDKTYEAVKKSNGDVAHLDYPEFAEQLLVKYGCSYGLDIGYKFGGLCDYKKRKIRLTYNHGVKLFEAFWEAAHEVGHAVYGQPILRHPVVSAVLLTLLALTVSLSGLHYFFLVPVVWCPVVALLFFARWQDEVRASGFAVKELQRELGDIPLLKKRLALDKLVLTLESTALIFAFVSATFLLYFSFSEGGFV